MVGLEGTLVNFPTVVEVDGDVAAFNVKGGDVGVA